MKPMNRSICYLSSACLLAMAVSACADYPDAKHPVQEGWRVAHMDHEVSLDESTPLVRFSEDCRSVPVAAGQPEPVRWALLHFSRPPEDVYRVVPVMGGMPVVADQQVYVNVNDCAQAVDKR